jgi:hypothetical protein
MADSTGGSRRPCMTKRTLRNRRIKFEGMPIQIESWPGEEHEGHRVTYPYGHIVGTNHQAADNMAVDVFLGPYRTSRTAFIIDAVDSQGNFKQVKTFLGFPSARAAQRVFESTYGHDPNHRVGGITSMSLDTFRSWLNAGGGKKPLHPSLAKFQTGGAA